MNATATTVCPYCRKSFKNVDSHITKYHTRIEGVKIQDSEYGFVYVFHRVYPNNVRKTLDSTMFTYTFTDSDKLRLPNAIITTTFSELYTVHSTNTPFGFIIELINNKKSSNAMNPKRIVYSMNDFIAL